jgi:hypothetical protein
MKRLVRKDAVTQAQCMAPTTTNVVVRGSLIIFMTYSRVSLTIEWREQQYIVTLIRVAKQTPQSDSVTLV